MSDDITYIGGDEEYECICRTCETGYRGSESDVKQEVQYHREDNPDHTVIGPRKAST